METFAFAAVQASSVPKQILWQQVGEAAEHLPTRGGVGESPIKSDIEDEILLRSVVQRPQVPYRMAP
jgi:hypothetical protein